MKNNEDNYPNNAIKSFLRIETPKIKDAPFYEINALKNSITLYHPHNKQPSDRSSLFELDKIFTNEEENSYIFEEICLNTIKDCLDGFSYSFISYGDTSTKKIEVLIGDINDSISNINHRGIYPRLLESLINKIKTENIRENKYNLSMSFFMVYKNTLIDLSVLKNNDNININNIFSKSFTIKNETDIIKNIAKNRIEKLDDHLLNINNILYSISQIEKDTKENIYSSSHICLVLYLTNKQNNKIIKTSNISFILLNGTEYLYLGDSKKMGKQEHNHSSSSNSNKSIVEGAKSTLETQFTYETVFNCIKSVKCLNIGHEKNIGSNNKENMLFSNLTTVLYNICFGDEIQKIKFRIIGTIYPNTGFYQSTKDTILFLYECRNIMKRKREKLHNANDASSQIIEKKKDDYIFQLENKVKDQKKRIDELSKSVEQKDNKITFLQNTYSEQINTVKKKFNFPGDISVLISGDENTKEAHFVKEMREYQDCIRRNEGNIHILENKLKQANDEIIKLKNSNIVKNSDETMLNYYISLKQQEENRKKEDKSVRLLYKQIDDLKQEIKTKDQINIELQKEIQKKNDILSNLPLALKENYSLNPNMAKTLKSKDNTMKSNKMTENKNDKTENDNSESENMDNDAYYGEKMKKIKEENKKEMEKIKFKYDNLLEDKNKEIEEIKMNIKNINYQNKKEILLWKNELIKYNEIFMQVLSNYKRIFFSRFAPQYNIITVKNKKEEFDKILLDFEKEINILNFPKLFQELETKKKLDITVTGSINNMRKTLTKKKQKIIIESENDKKPEENILEKYKNNMPPYPLPEIRKTVEETINNNNKKIIINKEKLESMSKEMIIIHCLNLNKKIEDIEGYLEKYAQYRKGFNIEAFENNVNYKESTIKELNERIDKLRKSLDEQVQVNYNNMNVINTQNRMIEKFQKEKLLYNIFSQNRKKNYNGSMFSNMLINENSTYSTLVNSINKNNKLFLGRKKMKKSNSCLNLNPNENIEQQLNKKDLNLYFTSGKVRNEFITIKNNENNQIMNNQMRPFSSTRELRKKKIID